MTTPSGKIFGFELSGTKQSPKITLNPVIINGIEYSGKSEISTIVKDGKPLKVIKSGKVVIPITEQQVKDIMNKLPNEKYVVSKEMKTLSHDGRDYGEETDWDFGKYHGSLFSSDGKPIRDGEMKRFLNANNITNIDIHDAIRMWESEQKDIYNSRLKNTEKRFKSIHISDIEDQG